MNYTGFWRRFVAYMIDAVILAIPGLLAGGAIRHFGISISMNVILGILYYPVFESSIMSATPGKALMGIVVLSEQGERLSFKAALIRHLLRFLSALVCYIGYIMQVFTKKRQALHDMLSESIVIDRESADLNYFVVWKDHFKEVLKNI
ncbi:RDD family protein [Pseudobdellovibrio exovorus]|uniref:RDD domain-containing protein n=1 Tax=Pseudobdellovibrio exovorus JSS TaxID=1184267 RepID=M4V9Y2_9BACT|nr:RDD family protein [Pseudobdellovibrio exovorus]AGH95270.1 hypothetical protein A11Q_1054 [Pseudobdellovibrio exovorus JSS]